MTFHTLMTLRFLFLTGAAVCGLVYWMNKGR